MEIKMNSELIKIEQFKPNVDRIEFPDGKILYLIGTAHISEDSVNLVEEMIETVSPDTIAVELDNNRYEMLKNRKRFEQTDIFEIFKSGKVLFFTAQLLLSGYQKKMAEKTGIQPGSEFKKAIELADEKKIRVVNADRDISITLKRTIKSMTLKEKIKMFGGLLIGKESDIDKEGIEELKKGDMLMQLIKEMGVEFPSVKRVILDERDLYLAGNIFNNLGQTTVAVVGAAHVPGIIERLKKGAIKRSEMTSVEFIPSSSKIYRFIPWIIPAIVALMFVWGFITGDAQTTGTAAIYWVMINGILSALGCIAALGHPVTILSGFIAAPITSLNPTIGAGIVTGLVQLYLVKPLVEDFESVSKDTMHWKGWWKNRLTRALLVSLFSSIGSSIGTFVAFPFLMKILL
jgi:pheromone shutdown-related protein TraB